MTVRLTTAQALVRFLAAQEVEAIDAIFQAQVRQDYVEALRS